MDSIKCIFDSRWLKSGGIGRFCKEIMQAQSLDNCNFIEGELSSALSAKDPINLSKAILGGSYFISPGYNCPLISMGRAIVTIHDLMHLKYPDYSGIKNKLYYDIVVKRAVKSAPLVFTVSEFTRQEIAQWAKISINKIAVVPNGVDHAFYHYYVKPIKRSRPYFFYVGNSKTHKNLSRLMEAFSLLKEDTVDLLLSCSATKELSELVVEFGLTGRVIFLSGIDEEELPSYYKGAIATVMTTLYEGFGLPILESMAVGTPVITSNITAMPEVAGGAAALVDPYDVNAIRDRISRLITDKDEWHKLSDLGLKRAQFFSWDKSRLIWDLNLSDVLRISND